MLYVIDVDEAIALNTFALSAEEWFSKYESYFFVQDRYDRKNKLYHHTQLTRDRVSYFHHFWLELTGALLSKINSLDAEYKLRKSCTAADLFGQRISDRRTPERHLPARNGKKPLKPGVTVSRVIDESPRTLHLSKRIQMTRSQRVCEGWVIVTKSSFWQLLLSVTSVRWNKILCLRRDLRCV